MATSHELAVVTGQESHNTCNIIRATKVAKHSLLLQLVQPLLTPPLLETGARVDNGSVDGVDANGELAQFLGGSECNAAKRKFARRISNEARETAQSSNARAYDDGAAISLITEDLGNMFKTDEGCVEY
jgi:hypothetical protein